MSREIDFSELNVDELLRNAARPSASSAPKKRHRKTPTTPPLNGAHSPSRSNIPTEQNLLSRRTLYAKTVDRILEIDMSEVRPPDNWEHFSAAERCALLPAMLCDEETREGHTPRMSDLRESGSIEQDADVIMLLHREDYYDPTKNPGAVEVNVAKQRNGPTGKVKLTFLRNILRFEDYISDASLDSFDTL